MNDVPSRHVQIRNVLAATARMSDVGTVEEYAAVWTDDAVWEMDGRRTVGREAITRNSRRRREQGMTGPGSGTMHVVSTVATELLDPFRARARSTFQFLAREGDAVVTRLAGWYEDHLVLVDGAWRIEHRIATTLSAGEGPAGATPDPGSR